jgi:hypothetical protein
MDLSKRANQFVTRERDCNDAKGATMTDTTDTPQAMFARVQALYDAEVAANRPALTAADVPLSYDAVTDRWLTAALCASDPDARVLSHRFGTVDDGTTNRRRLTVEYNEWGQASRLTERIFCKASFGVSNRFSLGPVGALEAEVAFYNHVRPYLKIEATEGVFAVVNEAYNSVIMLKDISDTVTEFCDHTTTMTRTRAESQMRTLAALHGAGASDPRLLAAHDKFKSWYDFFHGTKGFGLDQGAKAGFEAAGGMIPARTHARAPEVWAATERAVARSHERPKTIAHGDVHLKNWYVAGSGEMGLSDWQCTTIGHWGRDVSYTLGTALTVENRRAWERDLIRLYLEELARHGGPVVSFDQAWTIYREQMLPAMAWWTITLNPAPGMPEMQPRPTAVEFVTRLGTAMDDLDSLDA